MSVSVDQFGKSLVASGLMSADEVKVLWTAVPAGERPKDGEGFAALLIKQGKLNEFQSQELLAGSKTPLVLDVYMLVAKIGAGGMGQVYKAKHRRMDRFVALKVMSAAAMADEGAVKRFQREVRAAARLEHPNIVTAYDSGEAGNTKYLVMQFVDGGDLSSLVKKGGPLPIERAVDYIIQAAKGLAFAHGEGVIHRDIKPANLLLDKKGTVKILDMGLARIENSDDGLTATEQVMGTVDYMSPEQAANTKGVDARADIYSLGCTLWFLLTGKKTYEGDTMIARLMAHRDAAPPSLVKTRDDVSWTLEQAFHKMIAKAASDRFQSMDEVIAALEPFAPSSGSRSGMGSSIGMGSGPQNAELSAFLKNVGPPSKSQSQVKPAPSKTDVGVEATAQFAQPEAATDPKSEILPPPKKAADAKPQAKGNAKKSKPPVALIAGGIGGFALLVALGVWVIVKDKTGNEVARVAVPAGGTATVVTQPPVAAPKTPVAATPTKTLSLADLLDSRDYVWSEPENLGPTVNGSGEDQIAGLTSDELRLLYRGQDANGIYRVCEAVRDSVSEPFRKPPVGPSITGDLEPYVSGDGLTIVAAGVAGPTNRDITLQRRPKLDAPWGAPVNLGPQVNGPTGDGKPTLSPDGLTLLFSTPRNAPAGSDLWISRRKSQAEPFGPAASVGPPINRGDTAVHSGMLLADNRTFVFRRSGVLHMTFATQNGVGSALEMRNHPFTNDSLNAIGLWFSPDCRTAYFSSARPGGLGGTDIWVTRRVPKGSISSLPSPLVGEGPGVKGADVVYLDDLPEKDWKGFNDLGKHGDKWQKDGSHINWKGARPAHALTTYPLSDGAATVNYELGGRYTTFQATIGVTTKSETPLTFRVTGDGKMLWESAPQSKADSGVDINIDLRGVDKLKLEVFCRGDNKGAHAVWIDPRLTPVPPGGSPGAKEPDVVYLDELQEKSYAGYQRRPFKPGRNADDAAIISTRFSGEPLAHALSMATESQAKANQKGTTPYVAELTYELARPFDRFQARVRAVTAGLDNAVHAELWGDGKKLWESVDLKTMDKAGVTADVDVRGVRELQLIARAWKRAKDSDIIWVDPRLTPVADLKSAVVYLDDLTEKSYEGLKKSLGKPGRNPADAAQIAGFLAGESPAHALYMHPDNEVDARKKGTTPYLATLVYELSAPHDRFQSRVRARPPELRTHPVYGEVWGDGKKLWESGDLVPLKEAGATVDIDVRNVRELTLIARATKRAESSDVLWLAPRLTPVADLKSEISNPKSLTNPDAPRWPLAPSKPEDIVWLQGLNATLTLQTGPATEVVLKPSDAPPAGPATIVGITAEYNSGPSYTDQVLQRIATLVDLESLGLGLGNDSPATKDGLPQLARLVNLRHLALGRIGPRDTNPAFLGSFPQLESLTLQYTAYPGWEPIVGRLPSLSKLWLHNNDLAKTEELGPQTRLTSLTLSGYGTGRATRDAAAKRFAALAPWCRITVHDGSPRDNLVVLEPTAAPPGAGAAAGAAPKTIPAEALTFAGHRYLLVDSFGTWSEAKAKAEAMGSHLATINSKEERDWVLENVWRKRANKAENPGRMFLGATSGGPTNSWTWVTGEPLDLSLWLGSVEPGVGVGLTWAADDDWDGLSLDDRNHRTVYFLVEWDTIGPAVATAAGPKSPLPSPALDTALQFDGDDLVEIPSLTFDPLGSYTLEGFITSPVKADKGAGLTFGMPEQSYLSFTRLGDWRWVYVPGTNAGVSGAIAGAPARPARTHVACVRDGQSHRLYVDGKLFSKTAEVPKPTGGTSPFQIGPEFRGLIDELRVSKVARYKADFTPQPRFEPDADTLGLYHFDEAAGDVLKDSSGSNRHGKITGAKWVKADGSAIAAPAPALSKP